MLWLDTKGRDHLQMTCRCTHPNPSAGITCVLKKKKKGMREEMFSKGKNK